MQSKPCKKHINTKRYLRKGRRQQSAEEKRKEDEKRRKLGRGRRGNGEGEISVRYLSRPRICARIPTAMLFFCCHKCHTQGENWRKIDGKRRNLEEIQENTTRKDVFFSVFLSTFGDDFLSHL